MDDINKQSKLLDNYMNYLTVIKNRSHHTLTECKTDLQLFFKYVNDKSPTPYNMNEIGYSFVDIDYIKRITLEDMYSFIATGINFQQGCEVVN